MLQSLTNFYAQWRVGSGVVPLLREDLDSPPESLLQGAWQHQRLLRDQLRTLDDRPVRILHPGFRSVEGGPDFRGAVVQVGDDPPRSGDVEIDLRASGWRAHGHDRNPAFAQVILHVIWEGEKSAAKGPPALALCHSLDASLGELSLWLGGEAAEDLPEQWRGRCCEALRCLSPVRLQQLLHQAAMVRLHSKASQFQARARQAGWEQSLWEGLFRGLGYKHNVWPMQRLAELRPRWFPSAPPKAERGTHQEPGASASFSNAFPVQARLLGLSGLLPVELTRNQAGTDEYVRRVWDQWWREREEFADSVLPRTLWHLHGLRPANHPQRRLALASHWSAAVELPAKLEAWCAQQITAPKLLPTLLQILQADRDDYWSWHWTFRSAPLGQAQPLLGEGRVTDLAVNAVLPWLWSRAVEGKNEKLRHRIEERYFHWPPAQDNSVLRLARRRLLGVSAAKSGPTASSGAAAQQGLMQIVRDFCAGTNSLCENCKLPQLAREFAGGRNEAQTAFPCLPAR